MAKYIETDCPDLVCEYKNCKQEATHETLKTDKNGFYRKYCKKHKK